MRSTELAPRRPRGGRRLSVVIPALDEADGLEPALDALRPLRARGHEVVLADGGSTDATVELAARGVDRVVAAPRGRARQMNAGAHAATGDVFVFLHADTRLPADADRLVLEALDGQRACWGSFAVRLSGPGPALRVIERFITLRSRLTGIATGDQALFVTRERFQAVGGFADLPLMEDVELCRRLKRTGAGRPARPPGPVVTSSRRWEADGVLRTVWRMWWLRAAYALGASPERLARHYRYRAGGGRSTPR